MKYIEVDEELYRFIASKTEQIGESASDILRRLLGLTSDNRQPHLVNKDVEISQPSVESNVRTYAMNASAMPVHQAMGARVDFSQLIQEQQLAEQKGAVGRFLFILESLYTVMGKDFQQVLQVQGRGRLYFATSKGDLLAASQTANPKEIGRSGYWVTTNNNTHKKQLILIEVLQQFGASNEVAQHIAQFLAETPNG